MPDTKNIPIRWGKYINHDMEEEKVMFIGAEKAIYGSDGRRLDEKLVDMEGSLSDAFLETKDYAVGEYCVYTNRVFKFTKAKTAGEWDGTAVIPVSLAQEISEVSRGIYALNSHLLDKTFVSDLFAEASAGLNAKRVVLCNQDTLNTPYKEGITGSAREGTAYINMTSANYGEIVYFPSGGNGIFITHKAVTWRGWHQVALKSDLQTIFPSKSYDASRGTFVNFDDITQSQIASVFIGNDGSNKTPTGRDGILLVFNSQWTVQLFFDYATEMLWRIKWGNWKQWKRISSLSL